MDTDPYRAALAGLLHDIGKFAQRRSPQVGRPWNEYLILFCNTGESGQ